MYVLQRSVKSSQLSDNKEACKEHKPLPCWKSWIREKTNVLIGLRTIHDIIVILQVWLYRISLFQIRPEPDLAGFRNSYPDGAGDGFGENLFSDHIMPGEIMPSTTVSCHKVAAQFIAYTLLLRSLPVLTKLWSGTAMNIVFFFRPGITLIKTANTPLDRSAALVLSVINRTKL